MLRLDAHLHCQRLIPSRGGAVFFRWLRTIFIVHNDLHVYFRSFNWPGSMHGCHRLCEPGRVKSYLEADSFKAQASEVLDATPVMILWCKMLLTMDRVKNKCLVQVRSMLALLQVIELLVDVSRGIVTPSELFDAVLLHLTLHQDAYKFAYWIPKHHYAFHIPALLEKHGMLIACFLHERMHKILKRFTRDRMNTDAYEIGALEDITCQHLFDLEDLALEGLVGAKEPRAQVRAAIADVFPNALDICASSEACADHGGRFYVGDVIMYSVGAECANVGIVEVFVCVDGLEYVVLLKWDLISEHPEGLTWTFNATARAPKLIRLNQVLRSLINSPNAARTQVTCIIPRQYRPKRLVV